MIMDDKKAKKIGQDMSASIWIGKEGISEGIIEEINRQVESNGIVKVKVLRNSPYRDIREAEDIINKKIDGNIAEIRGKTILIVE